MPNKDEITIVLVKILYEMMSTSSLNWDQGYFRFYSTDASDSSFQFMYRKGRVLSPLRSQRKYLDLLGPLMHGLFDVSKEEGGARPLVAVLSIDIEKAFNVRFEYLDPRASEIGFLGLGKETSYFSKDEIDIPTDVIEYQKELAEKGIHVTPIFGETR